MPQIIGGVIFILIGLVFVGGALLGVLADAQAHVTGGSAPGGAWIYALAGLLLSGFGVWLFMS